MSKINGPRILTLDIETRPIEAYVWGLWQQNVAVNQIKEDRHILSVAAKWVGEREMFYFDLRHAITLEGEKRLLEKLANLMNKADVLLGQNIDAFDLPIIKGRMAAQGLKPLKTLRTIDTKKLAKKMGFTSNRLEYLSEKLCTKYKKLKHKKYPGFELWLACLAGDKAAWEEMEKYNKHDVLSTEELYTKLAPWGTGINASTYIKDSHPRCTSCGSEHLVPRGWKYTDTGKYRQYVCKDCGAWPRGSHNFLTPEKKASLRRRT